MRYYKKAIEIKPDYDNALYNLGIEEWQAGNLEEAIKYYKKSQSLL